MALLLNCSFYANSRTERSAPSRRQSCPAAAAVWAEVWSVEAVEASTLTLTLTLTLILVWVVAVSCLRLLRLAGVRSSSATYAPAS